MERLGRLRSLVLAEGLGPCAGLLSGVAGCRLAWWTGSGAKGEPAGAG